MLDGGGDDMTLSRLRNQGAVDRGVVALSAAAGEDDLSGVGMEESRELFPRLVDVRSDLFAKSIRAGRIAPILPQEREHGFQHLRGNLRSGVIVEIAKLALIHPQENEYTSCDRIGTTRIIGASSVISLGQASAGNGEVTFSFRSA